MYACSICSTECKEATACVQCDCCGKWLHRECANVSPALFKSLGKPSDPGGCMACSWKRTNDLMQLVARQEWELMALKTEHEELAHKVVELEAKKAGFVSILQDRMDGLPEVCAHAAGRLRNLLFLGLRECFESDSGTRRVKEKGLVRDVLRSMLGQNGLKLRRFHRLGKWKGDDHPRPLLVEFFTMHDRDETLSQAFRLKRSVFKGVYVRLDTGSVVTRQPNGSPGIYARGHPNRSGGS